MLSLRSIGKIFLSTVLLGTAFGVVFSQVPEEYVANYEIAEDYDKIL